MSEGTMLGNSAARARQLEAIREAEAARRGVKIEEVSPEEAEAVATAPAEPEDPKIAMKCDVCGFKAKSNIGLMAHKRAHKE